LIEDKFQQNKVAATIRLKRNGSRQFRSKLSQEMQQINILPIPLRKRVVAERGNCLDSLKLRFQLSPAQLDKNLLGF